MSFSARMQKSHLYSVFFAPRGRDRLFDLGAQISQLYLSPFDKLIGVIGEAGSGKSAITKGMFPGLELTNDDDGVNIRPLPLLCQDDESGFFTPHTYHLDIRFEAAFTQMHVLADAILQAVSRGKRVIVEHFDLIYPYLHMNAHLIIGVGEEIIVTRPNLFGPLPNEIFNIVSKSLKYRQMAHSAEDLCEFCMGAELLNRCKHDDVKHGFILAFQDEKPDIDLDKLEKDVLELISKDLTISYVAEGHITIGDTIHPCTGPRTHVSSTGKIEHFKVIKQIFFDSFSNRYLVACTVGDEVPVDIHMLNDMKL